MAYLVAGFTVGLLLLANKGLALYPALWRLLPSHIEFLLFGWTLQLAFGIAYWILPRFRASRGRVWLAVLAYVAVNAGIGLTVLGYGLGGAGNLIVAGRAAEASAVAAFALHAWPRVKPPGA